jgi:hypothetical protein
MTEGAQQLHRLRASLPLGYLVALAAALEDVLAGHAARHGWGRQLQAVTRSALRVLLATQDTPGALVPATDVEALTQLAFNNVRAVTEVLAAARMLCEDRESALGVWFTRRAGGLPEPMAAEFRSWFEALRDGSRVPPRLRPRSTGTIRVHVARAAPILHAWADQGRQSLREITRQDIAAALPAGANQHRQALSALRSLFRFLKGRRAIFADPAARLRHDRSHNGQPLPLNLDTVREAIHSSQPARAALAARAGWPPSTPCAAASSPASHSPTYATGASTWTGGSSRWPTPSASGWPPGSTSAPAAGPPPSTRTCSSTGTPPCAKPQSATPGSARLSASPRRPSARTASWTRPGPPAATSADSATCSASPPAAPNVMLAPFTSQLSPHFSRLVMQTDRPAWARRAATGSRLSL